jgi:hypothetical protein
VVFHIGADSYGVQALPAHADVASKAYRLSKQTAGQEVYDVRLAPEGFVECDCPGFQRWRKPCKHIRALTVAGMLPASTLAPRDGWPEFIHVLSEEEEAAARAADPFARVPDGGRWPSDAQLAEMMELAPPLEPPTEEELNEMARYFGQE